MVQTDSFRKVYYLVRKILESFKWYEQQINLADIEY